MSLKPYACTYAGCEMRFAYKAVRDKHEQCSRHVKPVLVSSVIYLCHDTSLFLASCLDLFGHGFKQAHYDFHASVINISFSSMPDDSSLSYKFYLYSCSVIGWSEQEGDFEAEDLKFLKS